MKFTQILTQQLSEKNLLKHPFYQAWSDGSIPVETLRHYARQYFHHVRLFPRYLSATHSYCDDLKIRQVLLENLIDEERGDENHPELWLRFAEALGETRANTESEPALPATQALVDTFMEMARSSYEEGLGALFAYEHQIPEIARFKLDALKNLYGIREERGLAFFEVHLKADVYHTEALSQALERLSPEQQKKAAQASKMAAAKLWGFLDEIQQNRAA